MVTPSRGTIVVLNDTATIAHYGCKVVMKRIVDSLAGYGFDVATVSVYSTWRVHRKVIDRAVAVVVNGEGTLHHSAARGRTLVEVAPYCLKRKIPVFLINSVWQDNNDEMAADAASFDLRYVRESRSERQMADQGLEAVTVADLTLGWHYSDQESRPARSGRIYTDAVGMPATDLLYSLFRSDPGSRYLTMTPPEGHRGDYPDSAFVRLRPPLDSTIWLSSRLAIKRLYKRLWLVRGAIKTAVRRSRGDLEMLPLPGFMSALESAELVITGRFHGVCLCLLSGTPFLALTSNSHKIEGMLEDAGLSHRIVRPGDIKAAMAQPPAWSAEDAKKARAFVKKAVSDQAAMFDAIVAEIDRAWGA